MNWKALINKTIKAPFVPTYKGELDISNFEKVLNIKIGIYLTPNRFCIR